MNSQQIRQGALTRKTVVSARVKLSMRTSTICLTSIAYLGSTSVGAASCVMALGSCRALLKTHTLNKAVAEVAAKRHTEIISYKPVYKGSCTAALTGVGASLIIGDVEHILGCSTQLMLDAVPRLSSIAEQRALKYCFVGRFGRIAGDFDIDANVLYDVVNFSLQTRDIDLLIDYMKDAYDYTHFPLTRRLFSLFSKAVLYN